ncbi:MAG: transposase [Deltaproteobacteria bacterium]|nr:transposase [Deltaproteobacteria bacterium]
MNDETRELIALMRFKLISPVLAEPGRLRNEYFRTQAQQEHNFPHYGPRQYSVSAYKEWLKRYRKYGFEGLKPTARSDRGAPRRLAADVVQIIRRRWEDNPFLTAQLLYRQLADEGRLGDPPACYNTLLRTLHREELLPRKAGRTDARKRFEMPEANALWVCDFMHGPQVLVERRLRKAILCAIIDDHSRLIVGHAFSVHETISALTLVLKEAMLVYGQPLRFYVDNGPAFGADLLLKACAQAGISLIHSKPYDAASRGKIERFFRTVRECFLPGLQGTCTLEDLNLAFDAWLRDEYHHRVHSGTEQRPVDRYMTSVGRIEVRRFSAHELDEIFLMRHERIVNHDATISFKGRIYEVPSAYIRQRIEIRHPIDAPEDLALYDNGRRVCALKLVDVRENARTFCPQTAATAVSFADQKVTS